MTEIAIGLQDAGLRYGDTMLCFAGSVRTGQIIAVAGASGSGKSTLLNLIAGFEAPDTGSIAIFGRTVAGLAPADRPVSVIFQEHNLFPHLDVATNVGLGVDPGLRLSTDDRQTVAAALERVGLDGFGHRLPATLSGGERQRVALARALVRQKPILLLDEPFAALDPGLRADMGRLLMDLHRKDGNTILMVTHHPDDISALADRVMFLDRGRILLDEDTATFLARKEPPPVAQFLGKVAL